MKTSSSSSTLPPPPLPPQSSSSNTAAGSQTATIIQQQQEQQQQTPQNGSISSTVQQTPSSLENPARKLQNIIAIMPRMKRKVVELLCPEVRWFYRRKEDVKWTLFKGYDSIVLEVAYRRQKGLEIDGLASSFLASLPENVIVMDGNYRADESLENVDAIYWKEDNFQIRRGTWFYAETMQPLPSDFAHAIEAHHLKSFKGNVISDTPVVSEAEPNKKPELTSVKWGEEKVCWNSEVDIHIAAQKSNVVVRFFGRAKPVPLRRGFTDLANPEEGRPKFSDLILVVHGIGQKGYENLIAKNTAQIREAVMHQMEKYYQNEKRRPAILPVEWRSTLLLDDGLSDIITLPNMVWARSTLNSACMDLMYYHSPLYRTEIVNGVIKCMNSVYTSFMENNPKFFGPVSIIGHSLGSVIAYDILTNWSPFLLYDQFVTNAIVENMEQDLPPDQKHLLGQFYNSRKRMLELGDLMEQILVRQEEPLKFKVKYLFCLGSPLAVFILMRGGDYRSVIPRPDQVERMFNIFHPYDPVAYRLEPMFHENYRHIRPLKLFNYRDALKPYENGVYECHNRYLSECKERRRKEGKEAAKSQKEKEATKENAGKSDNPNEGEGNNSKNEKKAQKAAGDDEDESQHFIDESDSDLEIASSSTQPNEGKSPRSVTPQNIVVADVNNISTSAALTTPSTPTNSSSIANVKINLREKTVKLAVSKSIETDTTEGSTFEQPVQNSGDTDPTDGATFEQAFEVVDGEEGREAALDEDCQKSVSSQEALKAMGEAGRLIEEVSLERRIEQRIDFQVQPWKLEKSYWSMLRSHFTYWTNPDFGAFLLNTIYPPLEVTVSSASNP